MKTSRWLLGRKPPMGVLAMLASALLLVGCGGGGGGSTGPEGPVGPVGPPGGGSPEDPNAVYEPLPGVVIVITSMLGGT